MLMRALAPQAAGPNAFDQFWYQPVGTTTTSGLPIDEAAAMRNPTFNRCVTLLADAVGTMPLHVYRRIEGGGKDRASDTWQYRLLHDHPNGYQTSTGFKSEMMVHIVVSGNGMALKRRGISGEVEELWPLEPERTRIELLPDRTKRFLYRESDGTTTTFHD